MSNNSNDAAASVEADGTNNGDGAPEKNDKNLTTSELAEDDQNYESSSKKPRLEKKSKRGQNKVSSVTSIGVLV